MICSGVFCASWKVRTSRSRASRWPSTTINCSTRSSTLLLHSPTPWRTRLSTALSALEVFFVTSYTYWKLFFCEFGTIFWGLETRTFFAIDFCPVSAKAHLLNVLRHVFTEENISNIENECDLWGLKTRKKKGLRFVSLRTTHSICITNTSCRTRGWLMKAKNWMCFMRVENAEVFLPRFQPSYYTYCFRCNFHSALGGCKNVRVILDILVTMENLMSKKIRVFNPHKTPFSFDIS